MRTRRSLLYTLYRTSNMTFSLTGKKQSLATAVPGGPLGALNANKFTAVDTALCHDQRQTHSLRGHLPPAVESLDKVRTKSPLSPRLTGYSKSLEPLPS